MYGVLKTECISSRFAARFKELTKARSEACLDCSLFSIHQAEIIR